MPGCPSGFGAEDEPLRPRADGRVGVPSDVHSGDLPPVGGQCNQLGQYCGFGGRRKAHQNVMNDKKLQPNGYRARFWFGPLGECTTHLGAKE